MATDRGHKTTPETPRKSSVEIAAVIDIGSSAIRMVIAQMVGDGEWQRLDRAAKPVTLGRDVFMTGSLSRESMQQAITILTGFRELLRSWDVPEESIRVIATSAIREARNRDTFVDRIRIRTSFSIEIIEGIEENHLTYLAVQHAVRPMAEQFSTANSMIIEVGGGTTEIMLLHEGQIVAAHSLRIGTVRMEQQVRPMWTNLDQIEDFISENTRVSQEMLDTELKLDQIEYFVAVGGDARLVAHAVAVETSEHYWTIGRSEFDHYIDQLEDLSVEEIVSSLGITYSEAEGLVPALLVYRLFFDATSAQELIVPDVSIREGVLMSFALGSEWAVERQFYTQVIASAGTLGRRFHYDETHAHHVASLAIGIFDQTTTLHGLDQHSRLLLEVGATLHDIGTYVSASGHHKHGQYIVSNSELFGASREDLLIISNIVRYHRKAAPNSNHPNFVALPHEQRMIVMKLAAILRVADALDRGHAQRVQSVAVETTDSDLILHCECTGDISVERYGLSTKANLFEEVFGINVVVG